MNRLVSAARGSTTEIFINKVQAFGIGEGGQLQSEAHAEEEAAVTRMANRGQQGPGQLSAATSMDMQLLHAGVVHAGGACRW